jgi:hypothetical protein
MPYKDRKKQNEYQRKRREKYRIIKYCLFCHKELKIRRRKYCSDECDYKYNKDRIKKRTLKYYYKNRKKILKYQIERIERLRKENPAFHKKYNARHNASSNISLKGKICEICNERKVEHRHHEDYSKPLEVTLCCRKCHKELHKTKEGFYEL